MREGIHPNYVTATVRCACGHTFVTRSTRAQMTLEICSNCHPFYTGHQKLVDTAGRMEKFAKRFEKTSGKTVRVKAQTKAAEKVNKVPKKILSTAPTKAKPADKVKKDKAAPAAPAKSK